MMHEKPSQIFNTGLDISPKCLYSSLYSSFIALNTVTVGLIPASLLEYEWW